MQRVPGMCSILIQFTQLAVRSVLREPNPCVRVKGVHVVSRRQEQWRNCILARLIPKRMLNPVLASHVPSAWDLLSS